MGRESNFFPEIESLRGIAALLVVAHHCFLVPVVVVLKFTPPNPLPLHSAADFFSMLAAFAFPGQSAVPLFFVISGFVLGIGLPPNPLRLVAEWPGFAVRRAFRIFPAMWLSIILGTVVAMLIGHPAGIDAILENATFRSYDLNAPLWTLRVEFFLSLLLPALVMVSAPRGLLGVAVNVGLQAIFWWRTIAGDPTWQFAVFFHLGLMVPTLGRRSIIWLSDHRSLSVAVGGLSALAFCGPYPYSLFFQPGLYTALLVAAALPSFLIVSYAAFGTGWFKTALSAAPVRFMGRISYSLYILHFPIVTLFMTMIFDRLQPYPRVAGEFLLFVLTLAVTLPAAYLSYRYIERPFIRLGHIAADRVRTFARPPQTAEAAE
jgi:peptidoglycan/LPS O-acetylase OafA/YrhL